MRSKPEPENALYAPAPESLCSACGVPLHLDDSLLCYAAGKCHACYYEDAERVAATLPAYRPGKPYPHRNTLLRHATIYFTRADLWWMLVTLLVLAGTFALADYEAQVP